VTAPSEFERALGALYGLAIGDALGMPTQLLSPEELDRRFGAITWFQPAPDNHPIAAGLPAGHITDDTEQALLIARLLIDGGGRIEPLTLANALADWERDMVRRGSLDLLGPSTQRAISAVAAGISVEEAGYFKPHWKTYAKAEEIIGANRTAILFVANHAFDCIGAKSYGMRTAFIDRRRRPFGETPQQLDILVPTMQDLADAIV